MASSMSPRDIKEKIRNVLAINMCVSSLVRQDQNQVLQLDTKLDKLQLTTSLLSEESETERVCPILGTTKITIYKASEEFSSKTLEYIFCRLKFYKGNPDEEVLGHYLSIYELAVPGSMDTPELMEYFKEMNYDLSYSTVTSEKELQKLAFVCSQCEDCGSDDEDPLYSNYELWQKKGLKSPNPKELLVGICLYTLLLGKQLSLDIEFTQSLVCHLLLLSSEVGVPIEGSFWINKFAQPGTCLLIHESLDNLPLRLACLRGIQQMANTKSQGRKGFVNILRRLRWTRMEHLELIFTHLLQEPYYELLSKPPLNGHLSKLQTALRFLDSLPDSDVPYVRFVKDEEACLVLHKDRLAIFIVAAKVIASLSGPYTGNYMYPEMTPYMKETENTILQMIASDSNSGRI